MGGRSAPGGGATRGGGGAAAVAPKREHGARAAAEPGPLCLQAARLAAAGVSRRAGGRPRGESQVALRRGAAGRSGRREGFHLE